MQTVNIENRRNALVNGAKVTVFTAFEYNPHRAGVLFAGEFFVVGHDATEDECRGAYAAFKNLEPKA